MYFYPLYWPLASLIIFIAVLWATGSVRSVKRRFIRTLAFLLVFTPGVAGVHSAVFVFPLVLFPLSWLVDIYDGGLLVLSISIFVPIVLFALRIFGLNRNSGQERRAHV